MILADEITEIGRTLKPHGINGEMSATIDADVDIDTLKCLVFDIDGIYVPFFIKTYRSRGSEAVLLTIDGITDENEAAKLCGLEIYALKSDLGTDVDEVDGNGFYISDLIGFTVFDTDRRNIGVVSGYDDSTANTLLIVEQANGTSKFVPVADELIESFDIDKHTITLNLPEGLLDL